MNRGASLADLETSAIVDGLPVITDDGRWGTVRKPRTLEDGRASVDIEWTPGHGHDRLGGYSSNWRARYLTTIFVRED